MDQLPPFDVLQTIGQHSSSRAEDDHHGTDLVDSTDNNFVAPRTSEHPTIVPATNYPYVTPYSAGSQGPITAGQNFNVPITANASANGYNSSTPYPHSLNNIAMESPNFSAPPAANIPYNGYTYSTTYSNRFGNPATAPRPSRAPVPENSPNNRYSTYNPYPQNPTPAPSSLRPPATGGVPMQRSKNRPRQPWPPRNGSRMTQQQMTQQQSRNGPPAPARLSSSAPVESTMMASMRPMAQHEQESFPMPPPSKRLRVAGPDAVAQEQTFDANGSHPQTSSHTGLAGMAPVEVPCAFKPAQPLESLPKDPPPVPRVLQQVTIPVKPPTYLERREELAAARREGLKIIIGDPVAFELLCLTEARSPSPFERS